MKKSLLAASLTLVASGCATIQSIPFMVKQQRPAGNYVSPEVNAEESRRIASDMAAFLSEQLPPARTTIDLAPSEGEFQRILATEIAWRGFGVTEGLMNDDSIQLRYFVTLLDTGIVVRMAYNGHMAGRFYQRGASLMGGVYAVMEAK